MALNSGELPETKMKPNNKGEKMTKNKVGGKDRFVWDYPKEGLVYDKERLCFAKYPDHIKNLKGFMVELLFYPRHLDTSTSGSLRWISDKEIANPFSKIIEFLT